VHLIWGSWQRCWWRCKSFWDAALRRFYNSSQSVSNQCKLS